REHRGLSVERRIKAVFWWCDMHSPTPLSVSEILETMPTDKSINDIYVKMTKREKIEDSIPYWGDAVVWGELHHSADYPVNWD
ncbi:MAG: IS256 family transposase, partial [Firmicutes bacterium]|nr:IS256 family transposase [Bacillota bacterium]